MLAITLPFQPRKSHDKRYVPSLEEDFISYDFSQIRADAVILTGALVRIPHSVFATVLRNIAAALKDNGLMLITVKEGTGSAEGADGRIDCTLFIFSRSSAL